MTFLQCIGRVLIAWGTVLCIVTYDSEGGLFFGMMLIILGAVLMDWDTSPPQLSEDTENQSSTSS